MKALVVRYSTCRTVVAYVCSTPPPLPPLPHLPHQLQRDLHPISSVGPIACSSEGCEGESPVCLSTYLPTNPACCCSVFLVWRVHVELQPRQTCRYKSRGSFSEWCTDDLRHLHPTYLLFILFLRVVELLNPWDVQYIPNLVGGKPKKPEMIYWYG